MKRLQVCETWEVHVSSTQFQKGLGAGGDATSSARGSSVGDDLGTDHSQRTVSPALVGQAMTERAMSVIVVARRVDEDHAAQILLDAACQANIPVRLAAGQVMSALQADSEDGSVQDTLVRALGAVHPVDRSQRHDSQPAPRPLPRVA